MKVFSISDIHLSGYEPKPMDIFGRHWEGHWDRIRTSWLEVVSNDDLVLIPGDISWAMTLDEAMVDLNEVAALPGSKALLRGNHDYWWSSVSRIRTYLPAGMTVVQNDAIRYGSAIICGTRGWTCPGSSSWDSASDDKIYQRELIRLRLTLDAAKRKMQPGDTLIAMLHFPPFNERLESSGFTQLLEEYHVHLTVYGHLHGIPAGSAFEGTLDGVTYHMVSCDYLGFNPKLILET